MTSSSRASGRVGAVLLDRDGTLVVDVPQNGDPALVRLVDGAREAVAAARAAGRAVGVVTNQSAIGEGVLTRAQVDAVDARVDELAGPFDVWAVCPHAVDAGCACRKPAAGLVREAAAAVGADPADCVVVGDIGTDVGAARAAGAFGVLVPTPVTLPEEVADAAAGPGSAVAGSLREAVALALEHLAERLGPAAPTLAPAPVSAPGSAPAEARA